MITSQTKIEDIHTLMKIMVNVNQEFGGQIWWRGQPDISYKLQPSIFRPRESTNSYEHEININTRFMQKAPSFRNSLPDKDSWFEWLFLMQHYRHSTRLLDWTESPLIACYFAINFESEKEKPADAALFALSPYRLNFYQTGKDGLITPHDNPQLGIAQKAFKQNALNEHEVLAVLPNLIDQRMISQLAVFTIHDTNEPLENNNNSSNFLVKYEIPADAKRILKEQLKHAGIRPSSIFPDLEHLSKELKDIREFKAPSNNPRKIDSQKL